MPPSKPADSTLMECFTPPLVAFPPLILTVLPVFRLFLITTLFLTILVLVLLVELLLPDLYFLMLPDPPTLTFLTTNFLTDLVLMVQVLPD